MELGTVDKPRDETEKERAKEVVSQHVVEEGDEVESSCHTDGSEEGEDVESDVSQETELDEEVEVQYDGGNDNLEEGTDGNSVQTVESHVDSISEVGSMETLCTNDSFSSIACSAAERWITEEDRKCWETNEPGFSSENREDEVVIEESDSDKDIADAEEYLAAVMADDDQDVPLEGKDEEVDTYETIEEADDRRDRSLESGLIHYLMGSMPGGVNNRKQRRSKKLSLLFEAVRGRIECIGDHFWEYMQAYLAPYHYRKRTPSGHFIGHMPSKMLSGDNAEKSGFTAPERMIFQKMNDFEGPEVYDPGMWSLYCTVATLRKIEGGLPGVMVKRGLREALSRYNCGREYQARFGDEILPGMPGDSREAHQRVQELACLRKRQGPSSYFITLTLRMPKFPATCDCCNKILEERVAAAPHLPYLSRAWRRALNKVFEWLATGEERPLGIVSPYWWRPEYQAGQGKKAKGNLEHAHGLLWTLDRINDPDPEVRAKARADVSRRVTADVVEVLRQYIAAELPNPFAWAAEAQEIQNHSHSYSCLRNGQCRHRYPQPALSWAKFIEINVTVPESVEEVLEAMGVAERDGSTSELKLCPELQGGKNLPARSAASMYMSTSQPTVFTETDGSHHNVQHNDATQFENAYIVNYSAREDERSLVRITPKDKDKARLEFVDRNIRKRLAKEEGKKGKDEYHKTRESLPEPELVSLLHQQPSTYCAEVTDRERGLLRPIEFQHFSTALPSERYVVMKKRRPD